MQRLITVFAMALLLAGCGDEMADLKNYVAEVKNRPAGPIDPIPQVRQFEVFAYEPGERRDPFRHVQTSRAALALDGDGDIRPDFDRNREPLEEFPLESLRMVGTISLAGRSYALIRAPDAVVHRVSLGNHMGQNFGRIVRIREAEVGLMEIIPDGFGSWMERPAVVALSES